LAQSLSENRRTLALAAPIIAGFVGQMLMCGADTSMVGKVGVSPLAACAFANTVLAVPFVFGFAVLSSVSVRASLAFGSGAPGLLVSHYAGAWPWERASALSWRSPSMGLFRSYPGSARATTLRPPPGTSSCSARGQPYPCS